MRPSPTHAVLFVSGLLTLWYFADPGAASRLLAVHGVPRSQLFGQPWRIFTTALLHGGILHFVFNALWAIRLGLPFESRYGNRASLFFLFAVTPMTVACTVMFGNATIGLSGWGFALGGWMLVSRRYDQRLRMSVSDESMGTLIVWFALGFVFSWLKVLPIDNVAHAAGAALGATGALFVYRAEWLQGRSLKARRKAWKKSLSHERGHRPDPFSVALHRRDLNAMAPAFDAPELVQHTSVEAWDQWTEELIAAGDETNAKRTLSLAISISTPADLPVRLMRLSNLQHRSGNEHLAFETLMKVNKSHLRFEEKRLYDDLRKRYP